MTLTCAVRLLVHCAEAGLRVRAGRGQQEERAQRQQQPRPRHHLQQPGSVWAVLTMSGWRLWWCQDWCQDSGGRPWCQDCVKLKSVCAWCQDWRRVGEQNTRQYLAPGAVAVVRRRDVAQWRGNTTPLNQPPCHHLPPPGRRQPPDTGTPRSPELYVEHMKMLSLQKICL